MNKKKTTFFILWNLIIVLVIMEIVFHWFFPTPIFYRINIDNNGPFMLVPNKKLIYMPKPNTIMHNPDAFNADGYRGKIYPLKKQMQKKRVVFMGDSVTDGNPNGAAREKRFTELLTKRANNRYEVINLSVPGYNLRQELEYFKIKAIKYEPDYVIFGITDNDAAQASGQLISFEEHFRKTRGSKFYSHFYTVRNKIENFLLKSSIYKICRYGLFYMQDNRTVKDEFTESNKIISEISAVELKDIVQELKQLSNNYNFNLFFVFLPVNGKYEGGQKIKDIVRKSNVKFLDIDLLIKKKFDPQFIESLFLPKNFDHLNNFGHKIIADTLYDNVGPFAINAANQL